MDGKMLEALYVEKVTGADYQLPLPKDETSGSAGLDLRADLNMNSRLSKLILKPMARELISTGIAVQIPNGFEGQIRPRSGLALKYGVSLVNSPGTIDYDYRGELKVLLINFGTDSFSICHGMRIAQLIISPIIKVKVVDCENLETSVRGADGFGSTGLG